jgi:DNA polymerase-3 subunit beta
MRFIVSSSALLKQLQMAGSVINNNNALPILDNFLFELKPGKLSITASDIETTLTSGIDVDTDAEGEACVPARILIDTLKTFPNQPLTFDFGDGDSHQLEIVSEYGRYELPFFSAEEYPKMPELESTSNTLIPSAILATAIQKTLFATGNDELRPVMSGVYFQLDPDGATFVATDAHKLVRYKRSDVQSNGSSSFIMPKKPLNILKGVLASIDEEVDMTYNEKNCEFRFGSVFLSSRLIDGSYPNYDAVIPKENPNSLKVRRESFLHSIKRVSIFSNKTTHQIRLKLAGTEVQIQAEDLDFSNKALERLNCEYDGSDMAIGFNSRFLIEMLANLESDDIQLELSAPNRAGLLSPQDGLEMGEEILMLVMPVMINN